MFSKTEKTTLQVDGMTCAHCRKRVEDALRAVKGVKSAAVDLEATTAEVVYHPDKTDPQQLAEAVNAAGYAARVQ